MLEPLLPTWKGNGHPIADMRLVMEGIAWRFRTGAPWRDVPEHFGNWNTIYCRFNDWAKDGTWDTILTSLQGEAHAAGELEWVVSVDSTIARAHQHAAGASRTRTRQWPRS